MPRLTRKILLEAIDKYHLESIGSIREHLRQRQITFTNDELVELVRELSSDGTIVLRELKSESFSGYLGENNQVWWLYGVVIVALIESFLVVYGSQDQLVTTLRAILGLVLLGYLPGYSATRAIFPRVQFPFLERLILSIFLSVMVSIGIGTLLGAVFLFQSAANVLLLSSTTVSLALIGSYRSFRVPDKPVEELLSPIIE
ncbi:DUF1616 domain-containing protein [Candidatus Bathyarchaeota archaeon]|nr:MAG: DUF1616 domain-containing protein [Candidatus Bathyarchaeota archaeon]